MPPVLDAVVRVSRGALLFEYRVEQLRLRPVRLTSCKLVLWYLSIWSHVTIRRTTTESNSPRTPPCLHHSQQLRQNFQGHTQECHSNHGRTASSRSCPFRAHLGQRVGHLNPCRNRLTVAACSPARTSRCTARPQSFPTMKQQLARTCAATGTLRC